MVVSIVASLAMASVLPGHLSALKQKLDAWCDRLEGRAGYCLLLLKTGERIDHRGDERFPTASTIKTSLMIQAIREVESGHMKWTDHRVVPPMSGRQASMWSYSFKDGTNVDLDGWVNLMITVSDNTATMVLRDWLTMDATNAMLDSFGLKNTRVLGTFRPEQTEMVRLRGQFGLGVTTPNEMNKLFELLYRGEIASEAGCEKAIRILSHQYWDDHIGTSAPLDVKVASKSGAINRSRSDTAIVFSDNPYILTIYTDSQKDQRWVPDNAGNVLLRRIADEVWNALHPHRPYSRPKGYEPFEPTGGGVE